MQNWLTGNCVDHYLTIIKSPQTNVKIFKKKFTTLESVGINIRTVGSLKKNLKKIKITIRAKLVNRNLCSPLFDYYKITSDKWGKY